ncbi:uncharacterized protein KY384_005175 [Bacidia gigantensis]|uniref:uncharacterized protein n=1 Tax=Bacidia gigantensis TaxID=2732470 RepID=UPI001D051330|nr:uncharacterized protein KY384_005175 [Bacidia gigantensis]KAG8529694.1 hypothetical protein KY384_005175 [Bacidia gigantensis]
MSRLDQNLTFAGKPTTFNITTWNDPSLCTLDTCPENYSAILYVPNLGGNAFFLAWFAILLVAQTVIGIQKRTWTFFSAMIGGCILEVIGYSARILLHDNVFVFNNWLMYLICLTIAPCFFSAAIYLTFTRFIILHGVQYARLKPRTYTIIFITWDIISLALQAAGGGLADTASDGGSGQTGINIMIAGLSSQVASLIIFMTLVLDFAYRVYHAEGRACVAKTYEGMQRLGRGVGWWSALVASLIMATVLIFIRSCYRVAELRGGFGGKLANDEVKFMVLEGAMVALAALFLTVVHPAIVFRGTWKRRDAETVFAKTADRAEVSQTIELNGEKGAV